MRGYTLTAAWAWSKDAAELADRAGSHWDDPCRRPSHADKRRALCLGLLGAEIRRAVCGGMSEGDLEALAERLLSTAV